jgi:preprotein translocase subunit SecG
MQVKLTMLKWLTITLIAVVIFITILLGLGYLLKEHEIATTQLKHQLDQERAAQKSKEKRNEHKLNTVIETSLINVAAKTNQLTSKTFVSVKQKILLENLTCSSKKQCVLINITFGELACAFAINTIGASLLAKTADETNSVVKCPHYPQKSQLSCQNNLCSYSNINN